MSVSKYLILAVTLAASARADFSYTSTRKGAGAGQTGEVTKHYLKGQKMMFDSGNRVILVDFDAQTVTTIQTAKKTYTVAKFADLGQKLQQTGVDITADVKETGQKKVINGFNASEIVMTVQIDSPQAQQSGMKMQMEMDIWVSADVPGSQEQKAFYQKNMARFPWAAMAPGGNPSIQKVMVDLQRKMAGLNGVPVMEVVKMKSGGNEAQAAQAQPGAQQGMAQARARLEELQKQGGPGAAAAAQALARMGGASSGGSMFESTVESSNFSTSAIPDSVFAVPAGFTKVDK